MPREHVIMFVWAYVHLCAQNIYSDVPNICPHARLTFFRFCEASPIIIVSKVPFKRTRLLILENVPGTAVYLDPRLISTYEYPEIEEYDNIPLITLLLILFYFFIIFTPPSAVSRFSEPFLLTVRFFRLDVY